MSDDLTTYAENTWCPGCGNFGIFNAFKNAVRRLEQEDGISRNNILITAGIGCHAKIFDYLDLSGFYSLHGREIATAQGMKLANPSVTVVAFAGDGDAFGEGIEHLIFAAKRNADITVIIHDNGVYGLTTGQFTPTSPEGFRGPSTPFGSPEEPLNPIKLMLSVGATFVARGFSGKLKELTDVFYQAMKHKGFSFVDVLQPCVSFNDTYKLYNSKVEILPQPVSTVEEAMKLAEQTEKLPIGIFYQVEQVPTYHERLLGDLNIATQRAPKEQRWESIRTLLQQST